MDTVASILQFGHQLWRASRRHYIVVILSTLFWCAAISIFTIAKGPLYTSSMTVRAAESSSTSALSSALKKLPISVGPLGSSSGALSSYVQLLQSSEVARLLMEREHFERKLFSNRIDEVSGKWKRGLLHPIKATINEIFGITSSERPTISDVQQKLMQFLAVNEDQMSGLVTVSCTSDRRFLCRELLLSVHRQAEYRLGQIQREQATQGRTYILANMDRVTDNETRQFMFDTLNDANNRIILTDIGTPIGAVIVTPPMVPEEPSFPKPILIIAFGIAFGLAFGLAIAWLLDLRAGSPLTSSPL